MAKHEEKTCQQCGQAFECKVGSITLCQCTTITLSEAEQAFISLHFDDCLCVPCLKELQQQFHQHQFRKRLKRLGNMFD